MMVCESRSTEKHPKDSMCKDAVGETRVKENREGARRTGWKNPDHIQLKEAPGEALGIPVP